MHLDGEGEAGEASEGPSKDDTYTNSHRIFLQKMMAKSVMTKDEALLNYKQSKVSAAAIKIDIFANTDGKQADEDVEEEKEEEANDEGNTVHTLTLSIQCIYVPRAFYGMHVTGIHGTIQYIHTNA